MQSFRNEEAKEAWFGRHLRFAQHLRRFNPRQRAIAVCVFDADMTGIGIPVAKFQKISGMHPWSFRDTLIQMDKLCLR